MDGKTGNVIIGDPTGTSSHSLDVHGTANVGALTAKSLVVENDGDIGSTGATDAMQISSGGIVTFKDDIKIKDDGTIGSASAPTAMTIDSSGIVTFVDDIKIKNDGTIGSAGAATAMTIDSGGIVTFVDDIKIKDSGTIGSATTPGAITVAGDGAVTLADDLTITGNLTVSGDTVSQDVTNLTVEDRIILAAKNASGSPSLDAGLMVSRGAQGNVFIGYDESVNKVVLAHTSSPHTNTSISATSAANLDARHMTAESLVLSGDAGVLVPNDGNIGSAGSTAAIQIASDGVVTFVDDIKIKDGGTIGSATTVDAMTVASDGIVTFKDDIKIKDGGTIGNTSVDDVMTLASTGIVTFKDDIVLKNDVTIGTAGAPTAMTIDSAGIVAFVDDIKIKDGGTFGTATTPAAVTLASDGEVTVADNVIVSRGVGVAGNTAPTTDGISLGVPANVIIRTVSDKGGNVIIGDATATTPHLLDVRGTANVGALTAVSLSGPSAITISDGGTVGSATTTDAITIASDGIVTFKDDIKIKNDGTIGSAGAATAMTIDSSGIVTFVDDIKIKDGGTVGSATTAGAITIASDGIVTFVDDIKIKDGGTIGSASAAGAITISAAGKTDLLSTAVAAGLGVAGNTSPAATHFSLGTPANAIIRTHTASGKANIIVGDATATSGFNLDVRGSANVASLSVAGLDVFANDFATFARLNANINVVQDNVASITGTTLAPATNVITSVAGANAYGIGAAVTVIARTRVLLSGINQLPTTDYVVPSSGVVQLTDPATTIPAGIPIQINYWN